MVSVAIWGASEWGKYVTNQIEKYFPNTILISNIVDSNYKNFVGVKINNQEVKNPQKLNYKDLDYIIICSRKYKEIAESIFGNYNFSNIIFAEILWPEKDSLFSQVKWERLKFYPYGNCDTSNITDAIKQVDGKLNQIGIQNRTDKASIVLEEDGSFRLGHNYLKYYERIVNRYSDFKICEFGCFRGASLKTWKNRYQDVFVVGVDIDETTKGLEEDRIDIVIGNATDEKTIDVLSQYGTFNVICDDASHAWGDIRITFQLMWNLLARGGIYILEDIYCGAQGSFPQYPPKVWDAQSIFEFLLDRTRILEYGMDWNPAGNRHHFNFLPPQIQKIESEIATITFINGSCIIEKC